MFVGTSEGSLTVHECRADTVNALKAGSFECKEVRIGPAAFVSHRWGHQPIEIPSIAKLVYLVFNAEKCYTLLVLGGPLLTLTIGRILPCVVSWKEGGYLRLVCFCFCVHPFYKDVLENKQPARYRTDAQEGAFSISF